ncbi:MAG: hypothetical protein LC725_13040, partial [Lentisphaerae bacterium]|nr:hypothetical protein [Lentisphaerota bacterium]
GGAYSSYRQAPEGIERFSPNMLLFLAAHRPGLDHPEQWEYQWNLIDGWLRRTEPGQMLRNSNNYYDLVIHPRSFDRELKALKGISLGDWNEVRRGSPARGEPVSWHTPGKDHLNQYVNARLLWNADLDLDALLEEYYTLFFGPARDAMQAAVEYAENNYTRPGRAQFTAWKDRIRYVELLNAALARAGDTVYGRRIQLMIDEIQPLERMREAEALEQLRGDAPEYSGAINMANKKFQASQDTFVLDGKADELFWTVYSGGRGLADALTGKKPAHRTGFMGRWHQDKLYFVIDCADEAGAPLNITATEDGDPAILEGDHVEILLETDVNSYYRIVVNPAGALLDMDMADEGAGAQWSSMAEVAAHVREDGWSVEVCVPVLGEDEGMLDPLHNVVGRLPTSTWPWHFNIGRVRVRDDSREFSAFVPTGKESLQDRSKFARFATR